MPTTPGWSPSVRKALLWASGCAALGGDNRPITSDDLFVGLLLAHPDPRGEVWQFLDHFGLTARDVLPDDRRVLNDDSLRSAAAAAREPYVSDWSPDVSTILDEAGSRAIGQTQVLHVLASLLSQAPWPERLQPGLTRFGIPHASRFMNLGGITTLRGADRGRRGRARTRRPVSLSMSSVGWPSWCAAMEHVSPWEIVESHQRHDAGDNVVLGIA